MKMFCHTWKNRHGHILRALGQYLQSLISYRTRYDDACMSTDDTPKPCGAPFTAQELRGYLD